MHEAISITKSPEKPIALDLPKSHIYNVTTRSDPNRKEQYALPDQRAFSRKIENCHND